MNTEQIIEALECCFSNGSCDGCPYTERVDCRRELERNALALIKELQAHNENLKKENKYPRESLDDEREHKKDMKGIDDIVRCKDCIFCKHNSSALTYRCDRRGYYPEEVKESGFCSYGRRTDDEV